MGDPAKAAIPEAPQLGQGTKGRLGSSLTASIMKNLVKHDVIDDDPRAALLKYADKGKKIRGFSFPCHLIKLIFRTYLVWCIQTNSTSTLIRQRC